MKNDLGAEKLTSAHLKAVRLWGHSVFMGQGLWGHPNPGPVESQETLKVASACVKKDMACLQLKKNLAWIIKREVFISVQKV